MSFLTGYLVGGAINGMIQNTTKMTESTMAIINHHFAGPTWQDHYNELMGVALEWQSHSDQWQRRAEWLEAEVERLKAIR